MRPVKFAMALLCRIATGSLAAFRPPGGLACRISFARFIVLAASVCRPAGVARAQSRVIRMGAPFSDLFGMPFYAKDAGAFAKIGFEPEPVSFTNGATVIEALAGGNLELAASDYIFPILAINRGLPIQLVANGGLYRSSDPYQILAVAKNSPLRQARDLEGKTIAAPTVRGFAAGTLMAWLRRNGADETKVKLIELPSATMVTSLERGTIDACILVEPFLTMGRGEVRELARPHDAVAKEFPISGWFASKPWFEADRDRASGRRRDLRGAPVGEHPPRRNLRHSRA